MKIEKKDAHFLLTQLDFGSSIAEQDDLLESARVETSVFFDLSQDKVDLIPGTKGSGKSALFRIFVEFLPQLLLLSKKVVIAHGVQKAGDRVFHAYKDHFEQLSEDDFFNFWCIYLTSLAHEQFIKNQMYEKHLVKADSEIKKFKEACERANIPEIKAQKTLKDILAWSLGVLKSMSPKLKYKLPEETGELEIDLFGNVKEQKATAIERKDLSLHVLEIRDSFESVLKAADLSVWLMIDKLDEIFPRRSEVEAKALRSLLRVIPFFSSTRIRIKVFMRDDMFEQIVSGPNGFTALTHVASRKSDTLRWSAEQIQWMVLKRIMAKEVLLKALSVDNKRIDKEQDYRNEVFYKVFPRTVFGGKNQSDTLHWLYNHVADARGVVTPRDILDLLTRARQYQIDEIAQDPEGHQETLFGPRALLYGMEELSKKKREFYLQAEFPHLWENIKVLVQGKTEYTEDAFKRIYGDRWATVVDDFLSIGLVKRRTKLGKTRYWVPYLYRKGLELSQGLES